jgi:DNA-binding NtrC family response regulator
MSASQTVRSNEVLLVDADYRTSQRLASLLRDDGFQVQVLCDGALAISRLSRSPLPGTLITELVVPSTDGESIARYARSRDPHMQIVVLTRHPHLLKTETFEDPVPVVLTKPLDYAQLLELLRATEPKGRLARDSSFARRTGAKS